MHKTAAFLSTLAALGVSATAAAQDPPAGAAAQTSATPQAAAPASEPTKAAPEDPIGKKGNSGFHFELAPSVFLAAGTTGFGAGMRFGYGIPVGPVVLVPGAQIVGGYFDTTKTVFIGGYGQLKVAYPLPLEGIMSGLTPYAFVGLGTVPLINTGAVIAGGSVTADFSAHFGGGLSFHPVSAIGVGIQVGYHTGPQMTQIAATLQF